MRAISYALLVIPICKLLGLKLLLNLVQLDYSRYSNAIREVFVTIPGTQIMKLLRFDDHMISSKLHGCKRHSISLLALYKNHNPSYDESNLIKEQSSLDLFYGWKSRNELNFVRCERLGKCTYDSSTSSILKPVRDTSPTEIPNSGTKSFSSESISPEN